MFDRIFSAVLTFCVLAGGTLAVGSAMLEQPKAQSQVVYLPKVEVNGKRAALQAQDAQVAQATATQRVN
jgi:hypothetical protein